MNRDTVRVGSFVAMTHRSDPMIYMNYAVPVEQPTPTCAQALIEHFQSKQRVPRLEFFADLWPETIAALVAAGFVCERTAPIMVLDRGGHEAPPEPTRARPATPDDVVAIRELTSLAFEMEASPEGDDDSRRGFETGRVLGAVLGTPVIASGVAIGTQTVREVAGIATHPAHRRKGAATAVIHSLLNQFFASGGEVAWLTPGDDGAQALYEKIGFRTAGTQVNYVFPGVE